MGKIISVVSGKGGAGKSTVAAGIGRGLVGLGYRVLLADTDWGLCAAEFLTENGNQAVYHMGDVLSGSVSPEQAIVPGAGTPDFLAAPPEETELSHWQRAAQLLTYLATGYDYVLVDRSAGFDTRLEEHLPQLTALVVCQPEGMSLRGAEVICQALRRGGCQDIRLVINRFRPAAVREKILPDIDGVCDRVGAGLLGIVPEDDRVLSDQANARFSPKAPYGKALVRIACRLSGQQVPLPKLRKIMK